MKKKILYLIVIIVIFLVYVLIRNLFFDNPQDTGRIRVVSSPQAGVFIDNVPLGNTPFESRYKPGEYSIKLIPEGENSEVVSWEGKITIRPHALTYVIRDLGESNVSSGGEILNVEKSTEIKRGEYGGISVISTPAGGVVSLDSDEKGISPLKLLDVPSGEYELSIDLPGFIKRSQKILITKGNMVNVQFDLALDPEYKTIDQLLEDAREKEASASSELEVNKETSVQPNANSKTLTILKTESGFLNVRKEPNISSLQIDRVMPGEEYEFFDEQNGWYKIRLSDGLEGWISGEYAKRN